jgi:integrase
MAKIRRHQGHLVVDWRDSKKKRHFDRVSDREAGKKRLAEILRSGERAATDLTFKEYAEKWLANMKGEIAGSTHEEYTSVLKNHVFPVFGSKKFSKIRKPEIREFITSKRKEYEPATIRNILAPVRGMYNQAIEDGEAIGNPAAKFGKQNRGKQKTIINPYSKEEVSLFLQKALQLAPEKYPLYLCAVRTGMRRGELITLKRSDIDFKNRLIHVQRTLSRKVVKVPKGGRTRLVDMSAQLAAVLSELPEKGEYLFKSTTETQLEPSNLSKSFRSFLEDSGLRRIRFHDLRHTFATLHIKNNQSLVYVRDQLGHSSIKVTADLYGHLIAGQNQSAANLLDD